MSGHSKWKTIKHQKGAADIKRGQIFTKLANAITISVREGGGIIDPNSNPRLRMAMDAARAQNMPKDNIERAMERGLGKGGQDDLQEAVYEGFAPHGINVIVEAATDNPQRTSAEIKNLFEKNGGAFGRPGSSSYLFKKMGEIYVAKEGKSFDEIFSLAVEVGAEDLEEMGEEIAVYTQTPDLAKVRDELISKGLKITSAKLVLRPLTKVSIEDQTEYDKVVDFLSFLEDLEDVQEVYSNLEVH